MNFEIKAAVKGRFKLVARKVDTNEITNETDWFDNLVLDAGLNMMVANVWNGACSIGTGSSEPTVTQTQLDSFFAVTTNISANTAGAASTAPYYGWRRLTYRFAAGVFNSTILTEVGIGQNTTKYPIWNRALIRDAEGRPTSITVLADEYLDVTVEIRNYVDHNDVNGSFNILNKTGQVVKTIGYVLRPSEINLAASYNIGARFLTACRINGLTGNIADMTGKPTGTYRWNSNVAGTYADIAYVNNSFELRFKNTQSLTIGNFADISCLYITTPCGNFQAQLSEPIGKTAVQVAEVIAKIKWGRSL